MIDTAVILARGLGKRMRSADSTMDSLSREQKLVADSGVKAMIPFERPFLDYIVSGIADAGLKRVFIVIGPEHDSIRHYYTSECPASRVHVEFAIQDYAVGTADAVVCAANVIGQENFLVMNSDNLYPTTAIRNLASLNEAGLVAFSRDALLSNGFIKPERIAKYAIVTLDKDGNLRSIIEKPDSSLVKDRSEWVSMNLWAITPELVDACKRVPISERQEYELPQAVSMALSEGNIRVQAVTSSSPVLDLSSKNDIPRVASVLSGLQVQT